jgi:hypothetical protein
MPPEPEIRIFLIQHAGDPRRHEARNVGVVISDANTVAYRLVKPDQDSPSARYRQAVQSLLADETYPTWLSYWDRALEHGTAGLTEIIAKQKATFPVVEAGRMVGHPPGNLDVLAERYFDELVLPVHAVPHARETADVRVLRSAGVMDSPHFRHNYALPAVGLSIAAGPTVTLTFPYAWVNGHVSVIEKVLYHGGPKRLTDVLLKFEHVSRDIDRVVMVDQHIDRQPADLRGYLQEVAQLVRLEDPAAPEQLRAAFRP